MKYRKLKAWLVENDITQSKMAEAIGIDRTTLNNKLNRNGADFTLEEVRKIIEIYSIPKDFFYL